MIWLESLLLGAFLVPLKDQEREDFNECDPTRSVNEKTEWVQ